MGQRVDGEKYKREKRGGLTAWIDDGYKKRKEGEDIGLD